MLWQASAMGSAPHPFRAEMMEPSWSPDGAQIVYHGGEPGDPIYIADRTGSNPRRILIERPDIHCHHLTWSPDGRFIYFVKGTPTTQEMDIWRIEAAPNSVPAKPERITNHKARVAYLAWLDDRTLIYSASAEDHSSQWLYTLDVEHRRPRRVSSGITEQYLSVAVSNTRPRRLVASVAAPVATLWTVPLSDRAQTDAALSRFPVPNTRARGPRFGSGYLLFLSSRGGGDGLWKLENGAARELWKGNEGGLAAPPAISADGRQICFSYRKQGRAGLYIMDAGGVSIRALAQNLDVRGTASWSPNGKWVAVAANTEEGSRVFKVPVDGGPPVRLLDTTSYHPLWSPDGGSILYAEPLQGGTLLAKAITPDKTAIPLPEIKLLYTTSIPYRFAPNQKALIVLQGGGAAQQNFNWLDLETGVQRRLTDFKPGMVIESFDVTPDGKQIVFDRVRENSDIVMMDLVR
jgi:Tol biopolymer transport system component